MSQSTPLLFRNAPLAYPLQFVWRAAISRVTDADTIWVERDTGCRDCQLIELRVTGDKWKGFNAAERFTVGGKLATERVKLLCPEWTIVLIETKPDTEKYGRWLSPVFIPLSSVNAAVAIQAMSGNVITIDPADVVLRPQGQFLDLAAHIVTSVPGGGIWQTY